MLPCAAVQISRGWWTLYQAIALGMTAYSELAFRVRLFAHDSWQIRRGEILVATHRAETDVPLLCTQFYWKGGVRRNRDARLHFAAREDMFERGFVAGFPQGLPRALRKLLYPVDAGHALLSMACSPVPYPNATLLRLGRALEAVPPDTPLEDVVPPEVADLLRARAQEERLARPRVVGEVLRGAFADLLWESHGRDALSSPLLEDAWRERASRATGHVRGLIDVVRSGEPILFFPEGRPSPDGAVGPVSDGMGLLLRRGRPGALVPVGVAYDPLTTGRAWAYVAIGAPVPPPESDAEEAVLELLRGVLPLTCGQVVSTVLRDAVESGHSELALRELDDALAEEALAAARAGRPLDGAFRDTGERRGRLSACVRFLERARLVQVVGGRALALAAQQITEDPRLARAALEAASGRQTARALT
jgi:hypothetical protein